MSKEISKFLLNKLIFLFLIININLCFSQISGRVFRDYNGNGTREITAPTVEPGVPNVVVNSYNSSNTIIATTTSANDGTYSLPFTVPVRIEFVLPTMGACVNSTEDFSSFGQNGNNIRFVSASTANLDYAINSPNDYITTTDPNVFIPQFVSGNPLGQG